MITDLSQLHEDVYDGDVVALLEFLARRRQRHELVVEEALSLAERASHDVLVLLGHLLLDVGLETAEDERSKDFVQPFDELLVVLAVALDHHV